MATFTGAAVDRVGGHDVYGSPPPSFINEVTNPSVEITAASGGWGGWTGSGNGTVTRATGDGYAGTSCAEMTYAPTASSGSSVMTGNTRVTPGQQVFVGIAVKVTTSLPAGANLQLDLRTTKQDGSYNAGTQAPTSTGRVTDPVVGRWYYLYGVVTVPANAWAGQVEFGINGVTAGVTITVRADAAMLVLNPPASVLPYVDGDMSGCSWEGTPHSSRSRWLGQQVNYVQNPHGQVDLTAIGNIGGSTLTRVTAPDAPFGTTYVQVDVPAAASEDGVNFFSIGDAHFKLGDVTTAIIWARGAVGGEQVRLKYREGDSAGVQDSNLLVNLTTSWQPYVITKTSTLMEARDDQLAIHARVPTGNPTERFFIGGVALIRGPAGAGDYFDGSSAGAAWLPAAPGGANNSRSIQTAIPSRSQSLGRADAAGDLAQAIDSVSRATMTLPRAVFDRALARDELANLMPDAGMEDLSKWIKRQALAGDSLTADATWSESGSQSIRYQATVPNASTQFPGLRMAWPSSPIVSSDLIAATPGRRYYVRAAYFPRALPPGTQLAAMVSWIDASGAAISFTFPLFSASPTLGQVNVLSNLTPEAPAGTVAVRLDIYINVQTGQTGQSIDISFDGAQFVEWSDAAPWPSSWWSGTQRTTSASATLSRTDAHRVGGHDVYGAPPAAFINELTNPSCETSAAGWSGWNGASFSPVRSTADAYAGSACAEISWDTLGAPSADMNIGPWGQSAKVKVGDVVLLRGAVKAVGTAPASFMLKARLTTAAGGYIDEPYLTGQPLFKVTGPAADRWYVLEGTYVVTDPKVERVSLMMIGQAFPAGMTGLKIRGDAAMAVVNPQLGTVTPSGLPYCDGDEIGCSWEGTAHASRSRWAGQAINYAFNPKGAIDTAAWDTSLSGTSNPAFRVVGDGPPGIANTCIESSPQGAAAYVALRFPAAASRASTPVSGGQKYGARGWVKIQAGTSGLVNLAIRFRDSQNNVIDVTAQSISTVGLSGQWIEMSGTAVAPAHAVSASLFFISQSGGSSGVTLRASAVQLVIGDPAPTYFDGDTPGCAWLGTAGASASVQTTPPARTMALSRTSPFALPYQDQVKATAGVISRWKLDETSGTSAVDDIGGRNGTYVSVALNQPPLISGQGRSVLFGGSGSKADMGFNAAFNPAQFTVEAWVQPTAVFNSAIVSTIYGNPGNAGYELGTDGSGKPYLMIGGGDSLRSFVAPSPLAAGSRYHLAATFDGTTISLYANGQRIAFQTLASLGWPAFVPNASKPLKIGQAGDFNGRVFNGAIDEVALYGRALSGDELASRYLAGQQQPDYQQTVLATPNLVAHWSLDETSGTTAVDDVGARNGTLAGGVALNQPPVISGQGRSMSFDGVDDVITIPYAAALNPATFSAEAWVSLSSLPTPASGGADIVAFLANNKRGWDLEVNAAGALYVVWGNGTVLTATQVAQPGSIKVGTRHHVVVTFDGTTLSGYVDGKLAQAGATITGFVPNASFNPTIGSTSDFAGRFLSGRIDEVALYSRALLPAEVAQHYDAGGDVAQAVDAPARSLVQARTRYDAALAEDERVNRIINPVPHVGGASWNKAVNITSLTIQADASSPTGQAMVLSGLSGTDPYINPAAPDGNLITALQLDMWPGRTYTLSCWVKANAAAIAQGKYIGPTIWHRVANGGYNNGTGGSDLSSNTGIPNPAITQADTWVRVKATCTIPDNADATFIRLYGPRGGVADPAVEVRWAGITLEAETSDLGFFDPGALPARWLGASDASRSLTPRATRAVTESHPLPPDRVGGHDVYGSPPLAFINEIPNPSCEVDATNWSGWDGAAGVTVTRNATDNAGSGTACAEITFTKPASGSASIYVKTPNTTTVQPGDTVFICIAVKTTTALPAGANFNLDLRTEKAGNVYNAGTSAPALTGRANDPTSGRWYVLSALLTVPANAVYAQVEVGINGLTPGQTYTIRADAAMLVINPPASTLPYADGSLPGCTWEGTAHNSRSRYLGQQVSYIHNPHGEVDLSWWGNFSTTAANTTIGRSTTNPLFGSACIQVDTGPVLTGRDGIAVGILNNRMVPTPYGETLTAIIWLRGDVGGEKVYVEWRGNYYDTNPAGVQDSTNPPAGGVVTLTTDWQPIALPKQLAHLAYDPAGWNLMARSDIGTQGQRFFVGGAAVLRGAASVGDYMEAGMPGVSWAGVSTGSASVQVSGGPTRTLSLRRALTQDYRSTILADNPAGYWRLGESAGTTAADERGASPLTYGGPVSLGQSGLLPGDTDKAAAFSSSSITYAEGAAPGLPSAGFTLEGWVMLTGATPVQHEPVIGHWDGNNATRVALVAARRNGQSGALSFWSNASSWIESGIVLDRNVPYHLAVVVLPSRVDFYVNGALAASKTVGTPAAPASSGTTVRIGNSPWTTTERLQGVIDEPAIYPTPLSGDRISAHYAAGFGAHPRYQDTIAATPGVVGRWKLDETSGTTAVDDIGGRNGTLAGGVALNQPPVIPAQGRSMLFDGVDDRITVPYNAALNPAGQWTVEAWATVNGGQDTYRAIVGNRSGANGFTIYASNTNKWSFWGGDGTTHRSVTPAAADVVVGKRTHVVGTYDGSMLSIYVDGKLMLATAFSGLVPNASQPLVIGANDGGTTFFAPAAIDEVSVYNRALSPAEVAWHYDAAGDLAQAVDTPSRGLMTQTRTATDSAPAVDAPQRSRTVFRSLADALPALTDSNTTVRARVRGVTDQARVTSDAPAKTFQSGLRTSTDTFAFADVPARRTVTHSFTSDHLAVTDTTHAGIAYLWRWQPTGRFSQARAGRVIVKRQPT